MNFEYHLGNIFWFYHILHNYFTSNYASEIASKHRKRRKICLT